VSFDIQGAVATTMTQPLDVLKTRAMNAKPGEFTVSFFYLKILIE
jgi:dicarboxylate transporter 10